MKESFSGIRSKPQLAVDLSELEPPSLAKVVYRRIDALRKQW
jgi:hypothetical protein